LKRIKKYGLASYKRNALLETDERTETVPCLERICISGGNVVPRVWDRGLLSNPEKGGNTLSIGMGVEVEKDRVRHGGGVRRSGL